MLEKLLLHVAASQLCQAAQPGQGVADLGQREIKTCQTHVDFYEWLKNTLTDPAWPTPTIDPTWLVSLIRAALATGPTPTPTPTPPPSLGAITPSVSVKMKADPTFAKMLKISPLDPKG